ncbi:CLASP N terminal [Novymonas esmeraldas]|uniref:CLASP N terminal n=1 Tax=Novymonas esmeraldas TaxID=1808958 RepID=A0AAW0F276_9TRYP
MAAASTLALTDAEVLRRVQLLGDTLAEEQRLAKEAIGARQPLRHWEHQVQPLRDVQRLLADDISGRPAFVGWMSLYLRNCLLHALQSRRAAVALAAIDVVETLAQACASRASVASVCTWFLPCLTRLAAGSAASASTVSSAAMRALDVVARRCLLTLESVNHLLCDCSAPNAAVRRCSLLVLRTYLHAVKGTTHQLSVNAYTDALHRVLGGRMGDADTTVRRAARRCFWALHVLEPASTEALRRTLPPGLQRQLAAERVEAMEELKAVEPVPSAAPRRGGGAAPQDAHAGDAAVGSSRTATLKDDLQSATASRARASLARAASPGKVHRQLLRAATGALPSAAVEAMLPTPHSYVRGGAAGAGPHRLAGGGTSLLSLMECNDWSVRRAAVLRGQRLCERGALSREDIAVLLTDGLLLRMQDVHFRVVEAAHACLYTLLTHAPTTTQEELHQLLPFLVRALVRNTNHARPAVSAGACHLLDHIIRTHEPRMEVLEAVLRAADDLGAGSSGDSASIAQRSAELLHYVVVVHPKLFSESAAMGTMVRGVLAHQRALEAGGGAEVHRAGVRAAHRSWSVVLGAALVACPDAYRQAVERLDVSERAASQAALRECFAGETVVTAASLRCVYAEALTACAGSWRAAGVGQPVRSATTGESQSADGGSHAAHVRAPPSSRALKEASRQLRELLSTDAPSAPPADMPESIQAPATLSHTPPTTPVAPRTPPLPPSTSPVGCEAAQCSVGGAGAPPPRRDVTAELSRDAVAHFLRRWPHHHSDCDGRREALLSLAEALRRAASPSSCGAGEAHRASCAPEEVEQLLILWERDLFGAEAEAHHHRVRWAALAALHALLQWPSARSSVARQLTRVLSICRRGLDDAFVEVQLQAACCLDALVTTTKLPADLCLGAIASCVTRWQESPARDAATPGWLELLHMVRRIVEQTQPAWSGAHDEVAAAAAPKARRLPRSSSLTSPVLHRVFCALSGCLDHCHAAVRLCAVLVLAALCRVLGDASAVPFLTPLSPAHRCLVDRYRDTPLEVQPWRLTA